MKLNNNQSNQLTVLLNRMLRIIRREATETEIEKAAKKAARTGNREDLHDYLVLRRLRG